MLEISTVKKNQTNIQLSMQLSNAQVLFVPFECLYLNICIVCVNIVCNVPSKLCWHIHFQPSVHIFLPPEYVDNIVTTFCCSQMYGCSQLLALLAHDVECLLTNLNSLEGTFIVYNKVTHLLCSFSVQLVELLVTYHCTKV